MCANMPNWAPFDMYGAEDGRFSLRAQVIGGAVILGSRQGGSDFYAERAQCLI